MALGAPDAYYLMGGMSLRGKPHCVVCLGGEMVHDPHPDGGGLVGPYAGEENGTPYYLVEVITHLRRKQSLVPELPLCHRKRKEDA